MFRNVYKEANDCVKGDREILDRAFLQAAQIEKRKSPVMRFSVIGTAVTAVVVLGAVFLNSELFFENKIAEVSFEQATETGIETKKSTYSETMFRNVAALEDYREINEDNVDDTPVDVPQNEDKAPEESAAKSENNIVTQDENEPENSGENALTEQDENADAVSILEDTEADDINNELSVANEVNVDNSQTAEEINLPEAYDETPENEIPEEDYGIDSQSEDFDSPATTKSSAGGGGGSSSAWSLRKSDAGADDLEDENPTEEPFLSEADVIRLAREICTLDYVMVSSTFDESTALWTVTFTTEEGSYQSIVLDENGILQNLTEG